MPPQAGSLSSPFPTRLRQRGRQPQARSPQPDEGRPASVMLAAGGRGRGPSPFPAIVMREGRSLGHRRLPRRLGGTGSGRPRAVLEGRASPGDAIPRMCLPNAAGSIAAVKRLGARHDGVSVAAEIVRRPSRLAARRKAADRDGVDLGAHRRTKGGLGTERGTRWGRGSTRAHAHKASRLKCAVRRSRFRRHLPNKALTTDAPGPCSRGVQVPVTQFHVCVCRTPRAA